MTEAEAAAEMAEDCRRMETGEMTEAEGHERAEAWRRAGEQMRSEADALRRFRAQRQQLTVLDAR